MDARHHLRERRVFIQRVALGFAGAFALDCVSIMLTQHAHSVAAIWPASGFILALSLTGPRGEVPWLVGATTLAGFAAALAFGNKLSTAGFIAFANGASLALVWAGTVRFVGSSPDFHKWRTLGLFLAVVGIVSPAIGILGVYKYSVDHGGDVLGNWLTWSLSSALGYLLLTPLMLVLSSPKSKAHSLPHAGVKLTATILGMLPVLIFVFGQASLPSLYIVPLALTVVSAFAEMEGATLALLLTAIVSIPLTTKGLGLPVFAPGNLGTHVLALQLFLVATTMIILPVAAAVSQARHLRERLSTALNTVETHVRERAEASTSAETEFLANMSHEIRTPLTSVIGFSDLLLEQCNLEERPRHFATRVRAAGQALLATVNDILDYSKLEAGQLEIRPEPVAIHALAEDTLHFFMAQAGKKEIALRFESTSELPQLTVSVDAHRLRQLLLNLIGNAVKFTETGSVTLKLLRDAAHDRAGGNRLRFEIIDTGPGIPEGQTALLFRRFSQVDGSVRRKHGGTGLGLAICKGLVEAMGGSIGVETKPGIGSTFWFEIPAPVVPAERERPEERMAANAA